MGISNTTWYEEACRFLSSRYNLTVNVAKHANRNTITWSVGQPFGNMYMRETSDNMNVFGGVEQWIASIAAASGLQHKVYKEEDIRKYLDEEPQETKQVEMGTWKVNVEK